MLLLLQQLMPYGLHRNSSVAGFLDNKRAGRVEYCVGYLRVTAHGQAVQEFSAIRKCHERGGEHPGGVVTQPLAVVYVATSFFGLYVIGTFQYFLLVVLDAGNLGEFRVQFTAFGVGDNVIEPVDFREPVTEKVGHAPR